MYEVIKAGGWLMLPILACSAAAAGIIVERLLALRRRRVLPVALLREIRAWEKGGQVRDRGIEALLAGSPLGRIVAAALVNRYREREIIKESVEDTGRHVVHTLERFLNTLGTIAAIAPLLGLLGTVVGMIEVFTVISLEGTRDTGVLADGISKALITTASGLTVAIPSLLFYRYFRGKVDEIVVHMEQVAMRLVDLLHSDSRRAAQ